MSSDTAGVSVSVLSIAATPGAGRLSALAAVELAIEGVSIVLRSVRMVRSASGDVMVDLTTIRDQDGRAVPIVDLPPELAGAIDLAVWREVIETASARARWPMELSTV